MCECEHRPVPILTCSSQLKKARRAAARNTRESVLARPRERIFRPPRTTLEHRDKPSPSGIRRIGDSFGQSYTGGNSPNRVVDWRFFGKSPADSCGRLSTSSGFLHADVRLLVNAMHLLIIFSVLEIVAILVVVSLCMMARRSDERTERALTPEEIRARRQTADVRHRPHNVTTFGEHPVGRWWSAVLRTSNRGKRGG